jgi:hypothetical protein
VLLRLNHVASFIRKCGGGPFDQKLLGFLSQPSLAKWRRWAGLGELIMVSRRMLIVSRLSIRYNNKYDG